MNELPDETVADVARARTATPPPAPRPRRIRIPFLLDVTLVDDPRQIMALNENDHVTRVVPEGGPLLNRVAARRVARAFTFDGTPLPTFTERGTFARARRQQALETRLTLEAERFREDAGELTVLADYVAGVAPRVEVGIVVQGILGRLFDPDYRATVETWAAARLVTGFPRALPPRSWWWWWSGKLTRSQRLLAAAANGDRIAIHTTTIAVHNVVETLARMQALAADPRAPASAASAVARCLVAPAALLRWCTAETRVAFLERPLRRGALVVLRLGRAQDAAHDLTTPFATGAWNQCPALRYVPVLLERVWTTARATMER